METFIDELKEFWLGYGRKPIKRIKTMEINDLAIGKWYKIHGGRYMKPLILMNNKLKADTIHLAKSLGNQVGLNLDVDNSDWWKYAEPMKDLEEIQQYLPDGHIDKVINWEVGKCYTTLEDNINKRWQIFKIKNETTCYYLNPMVDVFFKDQSIKGNIYNKFVPSTEDEIEWMELCIKKGKFVPKPVKSKELELIEGNWYEGLYGGNRHVFHYLGNKGNYFKVDKYINHNNFPQTGNWDGFAGKKSWIDLKPANMEEVFKYFPEERPKNDVKIEGEYYVADNGNIHKWGTTDSEYHFTGTSTTCNTGFSKGGGCFLREGDRKANSDEIQWLECCIKANKFIPKKQALKSTESILLQETKKLFSIGTKFYQLYADSSSNYDKIIEIFNQDFKIDGDGEILYDNQWRLYVPIGKGIWASKLENKPMETKLENGKNYRFTWTWNNKTIELYDAIIGINIVESREAYLDGGSRQNIAINLKEIANLQEIPAKKENFPMKEEQWIPQVGDWIWDKEGKYLSIKENPTIITSINGDQIFSKDRNSTPSWIGREYFFDVYRKALPHEIPNSSSMEPKNEDWCVLVEGNPSLSHDVREFLNKKHRNNWCGGQKYYGEKGLKDYAPSSNIPWGKVLTPEEFYKKIGKSMEKKEENLVGRYLKALKDGPQSIGTMKKGDYLLITRIDSPTTGSGTFLNKVWSWNYNNVTTGISWELMPIGFIPPNKEESKFVIGKWYECECYSNREKRTIKIEKIDPSLIWGDYIQNSTFYKQGAYVPSEITPIKEISISEIQQYLPEGHIDKLPIKTMEKFKIGDKVRCIGDTDKKKDGKTSSGWVKGMEFHIDRISEDIAWPKSGNGVYFEHIELVSKMSEKESFLIEAKKRFPVGCKFKPITQVEGVSKSIYKQEKECTLYNEKSDNDWWIIGSWNVYCKATNSWAEIVEYPNNYGKISMGEMKDFSRIIYSNPIEKKPSITIDSEVTNIKLKKSASVTLKNTEKEVVISVKKSKPILLTI